MKRTSTAVLAVASLVGAAGVVFAQTERYQGIGAHGCVNVPCAVHAQAHGTHGAHDGRAQKGQKAEPASTAAYKAANDKMHRDMAIKYSGDADIDFARGMVPHHQGAVDMAKTVLQFGKDPEIRKLAEEIVKSQEAEIAFMREWLKKRGQ